MTELTFTLTLEEANQILDALGQQPFKQVFGLIGKIQQQASNQMEDQTEVPVQEKEPQTADMNHA